MSELIWFSIPGAIGILALHLAFPDVSRSSDLLAVASAPVVGFILHQLYRTFFECNRGWETDARPVIALIRSTYRLPKSEKDHPFLIWEMTFYSAGIPDAFRAHNRSSWHYVMSFRSVAFASALSGVALACLTWFRGSSTLTLPYLGLFAALFGLFWAKSRLTYRSLTMQECAAFHLYRTSFDRTRARL
ncbi:MAG: hypothetical protein KF817_13870 [Phycisphaeraceae bacterium]|nr:hypothetical protein [Phycisphaeraceae bacterium]